MGDKSPKSKERNQKQRSSAKAGAEAAAKAKQASHDRGPQVLGKSTKS